MSIAVRPGTDAFRLLSLVVAHPGKFTAAELGIELWRPRFTTREEYFAMRRVFAASAEKWSEDAGNLLHRLQQQGLIDRTRPPEAAPDWRTVMIALRRDAIEDVMEVSKEEIAETSRKVRLLSLLDDQSPLTMAAWIGRRPSGAMRRAVAELVEEGLVILPGQRWPTEAGIALVERGEA